MCPVKQGHWPGHPGWPSSLDASWLEPVTREDRRRGLTTNNHIPKSPPAAWWGRAAAARIYCCKLKESESEVAQSCLTLCDPMDCSCWAPPSMRFSRQEYWSGLPFPSPGDLPNPGIKPGSPILQADAFPSEPPGKLNWATPSCKMNTPNI